MNDPSLVNSIIGPGTYVKGNITVTGLLRVDGDFSGGVKTDGQVIIGRAGRVDCTIDAGTVVVGGVFRGTIYARFKVVALKSALIIGNIYSPRIIAEAGVIIDGALHVRDLHAKPKGDLSTHHAPVRRGRGRALRIGRPAERSQKV